MNTKNVKQCIIGHTNTGKTTLFRILTKTRNALVDDRAGVTKVNMKGLDKNVNMTITDTPGFENAGVVDLLINDLGYEESIKALEDYRRRDLNKEIEIIKAIYEADIVFYVIALDTVPEETHRDELNIIKKFSSNIIGVMNKGSYVKDHDKSNRTTQWENFFLEHTIRSYVEYDFYWDTLSKQTELYNKAVKFIDSQLKEDIISQIDIIQEQNLKRREQIANIITSKKSKYEELKYNNNSETESYSKMDEIRDEIKSISSEFLKQICDEYGINFSPITPDKQVCIDEMTKKIIQSKGSQVYEDAKEAGTIGGVIGGGAAATAIVDAIITGAVVLNPVGWFVGACVGFASLCAAVKSAHSYCTKDDIIECTFKLSNEDIILLINIMIAFVWTVAYLGFDYEENRQFCVNDDGYIQEVDSQKADMITRLLDIEIPKILSAEHIKSADIVYEKNILKILNRLAV